MCLSGDEWVMKMWCAQWYTQWDIIQPLEGNPAVFNNLDESWGHYAKWTKSKKDKCCMISLICAIWKSSTQKNNKYSGGYQGWEVAVGETSKYWPKCINFSCKINKFWGFNVQHGDYS